MINFISVCNLKEHPRNAELFDEPGGEKWEKFVRSIKATNGAVEPIVVSEDFTIISGHRRVKAHLQLGLAMIPALIKPYNGDKDAMEYDLVALNVEQRGKIPGTAQQLAERLKIMERWYKEHEQREMTTGQIAVEAGMTPSQASNAMQVVRAMEAHPELKKARESENIADSTILAIARQDDEVQQKIIDTLNLDEKVGKRDVDEAIDFATGKQDSERQQQEAEIQARIDDAKAELEAKVLEREDEIRELRKRREVEKAAARRQRQFEKVEKRCKRKETYDKDLSPLVTTEERIKDFGHIIDQHTQDFVATFEGIMADSDFNEKFAALSEESREVILDSFVRIRDIANRFLSIAGAGEEVTDHPLSIAG